MSDDLRSQLETAQRRIAELESKLDSTVRACPQPLQDLAFDNAPGGIAIAAPTGDILALTTMAQKFLATLLMK